VSFTYASVALGIYSVKVRVRVNQVLQFTYCVVDRCRCYLWKL